MTTLAEYRERLESIHPGQVSTAFALELLDAAEAELDKAHGEYTLAQAIAHSGKSRRWFERRLAGWQQRGLARKAGRVWLLKAAVVPATRPRAGGAFNEDAPVDAIVAELMRRAG